MTLKIAQNRPKRGQNKPKIGLNTAKMGVKILLNCEKEAKKGLFYQKLLKMDKIMVMGYAIPITFYYCKWCEKRLKMIKITLKMSLSESLRI